ncbi:MAG: zinc ribbon domain-containing protein [Gemmatimonadales bacterium]|jgi:hypothetical protein
MELLAGIVVAVAALALVLEPLVRGVSESTIGTESPADDLDFTDIQESESPKVQALLALKEIEFDRATGKLSDEDYDELKGKYAQVALAAIKAEDAAGEGIGDAADAAEAAIQGARSKGASVCPVCGPRPESAATFCSDCGRSLVAPDASVRCSSCGSPVTPGGKFCANCGGVVAA